MFKAINRIFMKRSVKRILVKSAINAALFSVIVFFVQLIFTFRNISREEIVHLATMSVVSGLLFASLSILINRNKNNKEHDEG